MVEVSVVVPIYNAGKKLDKCIKSILNQTFKDFVDYLSGHLDFGNGYTYMLIPEICNSKNDCYYYGLGVK